MKKKVITQEYLFNREGFIFLKEYVDDFLYFKKHLSWKLPFSVYDRVTLFFGRCIVSLSWFRKSLYVYHSSQFPPSYQVLITFLQKQGFLSSVTRRRIGVLPYYAYVALNKVSLSGKERVLYGNGVDKDQAVALSKALGELMEREVSGVFDKNTKVCTASFGSLVADFPDQVISPYKYHRFLSVQKHYFKNLEIKKEEPIEWVVGQNFITKKKVFIPKQMTTWFVDSKKIEESGVVVNPTSNGSAFAFTKEEATLRGLLEVVQRDAFLVHWLTGSAPRRIQGESLPKDILDEITIYKEAGIVLHVLDITTDIQLPSICVAGVNEKANLPGFVVSASTSFSYETGIREAMREIALCVQMLNKEVKVKMEDVTPFISNLDKETRIDYLRGRFDEYVWFISGEEVSYKELSGKYNYEHLVTTQEKLDLCVGILSDLGEGFSPIVYTPEHPIVETIGGCVARVIIPKAFPLYLTEKFGTFDSDRLKDFSRYKGRKEFTLTKTPHVFT